MPHRSPPPPLRCAHGSDVPCGRPAEPPTPTVPGRLRLGLAHGSAAPRAACASSQRRKPGLRQPGTCRRVSAAGQPHVTPSLRRALRYGIRAAAFPFPTQVVVGCGIRSRPSRRAPGRCTGRQRPHGRPRERHPPEGPQPSRRRPQPPLRSPTPPHGPPRQRARSRPARTPAPENHTRARPIDPERRTTRIATRNVRQHRHPRPGCVARSRGAAAHAMALPATQTALAHRGRQRQPACPPASPSPAGRNPAARQSALAATARLAVASSSPYHLQRYSQGCMSPAATSPMS